MSLLKSTTHISLDLQKPNYVTVYAAQNDRLSRYINAELHDGPASFALPTGAGIAIAYRKPDGTGGFYDTLEDGSSAFVVEADGTVTIGLAEQALTVPGTVPVEIRLYLPAAGGGSRLTTWFFVLQVGPSVLDDAEIVSSDYYNVLTDKISQAQQLWTQIQAGFGAPLTSTSLDAMTDSSKVYVYVGTADPSSTPPMVFGHWYYWDGAADQWQDGGVYQSAAVDIDATLSQTGVAADAQKTGALAAPVFSSATAYGIGQTVLYNGQIYVFTADHAAGAWIGTDAVAVNLAGELESAVDRLGEWTDAAYLTYGLSLTSRGLTFAEENGALVVYGTPTDARRLCCLNGQNAVKTLSGVFSETLEAGTYLISMEVTGPATIVRWDYTYTTFSAYKKLIEFGAQPKLITFTSPVMIAFAYYQTPGEYYGTEADPTRITLHIKRLAAKDLVAREAASVLFTDERFPLRSGDVIQKYIDTNGNVIASLVPDSPRLLVIPLGGLSGLHVKIGVESTKRYGFCNSLDAGSPVRGFSELVGSLDISVKNKGYQYFIIQLFINSDTEQSVDAYLAKTTVTVSGNTDAVARRKLYYATEGRFFHAEALRSLPILNSFADIAIDTPSFSSSSAYHAQMAALCESSGGFLTQTLLGDDGHGNNLYKYESHPKTLRYAVERGEYAPTYPIKGGREAQPITVLLTADIHGREKNGNWIIYNLFSKMLAPDSEMLRFFRNRVKFVCVPYICASGTYNNADGVNINRDFPTTADGTCVSNEAALVKSVIDEYGGNIFMHLDIHTFNAGSAQDNNVAGWIFTDSQELGERCIISAESVLNRYAEKYPNIARLGFDYIGSTNIPTTCTYYTQTVYGAPSATVEAALTMDGSPDGSDPHTSAVAYFYDIVTQTICAMVD